MIKRYDVTSCPLIGQPARGEQVQAHCAASWQGAQSSLRTHRTQRLGSHTLAIAFPHSPPPPPGRTWLRTLVVLLLILGPGAAEAFPSPQRAGVANGTTAVCGDGVVEAGEDCDDGGICIGGENAGTPCTAESDCVGDGVCIGGAKDSTPCASDADCGANGQCRHCVPQGGDGCAANCTTERDVPFQLVPGVFNLGEFSPGTSGIVQNGDALTFRLPLSGSEILTIGEERDGEIPVVVKAASVNFPSSGLLDSDMSVCVREVAAKTCGGTAFDADGNPATDCTPGYTAGDSVCTAAGLKPCAFVHGQGNAMAGTIGCNGLDGTNISVTQDGAAEATACMQDSDCPVGSRCDLNPGTCSATPPVVTRNGTGAAGSAILLNSVAISFPSFGSLGFCSDSDPYSLRGAIRTLPLTTGTASGLFTNANGTADDTICVCPNREPSCAATECTGPFTAMGAPLSCDALQTGRASTAVLVGVFTDPAVPISGNSVTEQMFAGQLGAPACIGDCNEDGVVTVNEIITGVNIVLGNLPISACPEFLCDDNTIGLGVYVTCIEQAVNHAFAGCAAPGTP